MSNKAIIRIQPWHALTLLIALNILLALLIGDQYGQTWDEPSFYIYGERSYDAYMRGLASQPLIFGHTFINPKDVPFMTLFLASATAGFAMTDAIKKDDVSAQASSPKSSPSLPLVIAILLGPFAFTYIGKDLIHI